MTDTPDNAAADTLTLAVELTAAWLSNPNTRAEPDAVPAFLISIHASLEQLTSSPAPAADDPASEAVVEHEPAVTVRRSLSSRDHIISMIDGKPYRTLRRHLSTHGLTPAEYRTRYKLKADYPMVAPTYSEARREMARKIGLGRKPKAPEAAALPAGKAEPAKPRGRRPKAAG